MTIFGNSIPQINVEKSSNKKKRATYASSSKSKIISFGEFQEYANK